MPSSRYEYCLAASKAVFTVLACSVLLDIEGVASAEDYQWPTGRTAINLSYDDALDSQLDNAVPVLNKYQFRASFYVVPSSESFRTRLEEWRALASQGHELGNHTIYHSCRGSLVNREWVNPENDLDKRSATSLKSEIILANTLLQAVDGETQRTFTIPCGDTLASGQGYVSLVKDLFVAVKGQEHPVGFATLFAPSGMSGDELVSLVKTNAEQHELINIVFHGIGGDYLSVSTEAHDKLIAYLHANRDSYWVDSYRNIMTHVRTEH